MAKRLRLFGRILLNYISRLCFYIYLVVATLLFALLMSAAVAIAAVSRRLFSRNAPLQAGHAASGFEDDHADASTVSTTLRDVLRSGPERRA